jgi:hypothetical protein
MLPFKTILALPIGDRLGSVALAKMAARVELQPKPSREPGLVLLAERALPALINHVCMEQAWKQDTHSLASRGVMHM